MTSRNPISVDAIVIGGGIAGMVAANRLAQLKRSVLVLEKGADDQYPCNTRFSGGGLHINFASPLASRDVLRAKIEDASCGYADPGLVEMLVSEAPRLVAFLRDEGVRIADLGPGRSCVLMPPPPNRPGLDWKGRGGDVMLRTLDAALAKRGGTIVRGARAQALDTSSKHCIEVKALCDGTLQSYVGADVIIADGGFQADPETVKENISSHFGKILQRGAATGTGDGARMARAVGASIGGALDCFYGHLMSRDAIHNNNLWPRPMIDDLVSCSIAVNERGERFADEGYGGVYMANAVARLPDPLSAFAIFDHPAWIGPGTANIFLPTNPHLTDAGATLHKASSIVELAKLLGIAPAALENTVKAYNEALSAGNLSKLLPPRRADRYKPMPIATAPFYGAPLCAGMTYTMGGLLINDSCAVLNKDGNAIPHLYAAGATTGGLEGGPSVAYIGGLTKSGVTGLRAAERIAGFNP